MTLAIERRQRVDITFIDADDIYEDEHDQRFTFISLSRLQLRAPPPFLLEEMIFMSPRDAQCREDGRHTVDAPLRYSDAATSGPNK